MYPSSSGSNGNNPIPMSYTHDYTISHRHFFSDINYNCKQDQDPPPSSFFHIPSPYIHYEDEVFLQHLPDLLQQQPAVLTTTTTDNNTVTEAVNESNKDDCDGILKEVCNRKCDSATEQMIPRKRSSKKDRHSKINTAHGPRDRRMRLSLEVARKFFDLQDMLGFDKASKTVEWLLTKSKAAIKELARGFPQIKHSCSNVGANSSSSTSECEVVSGIDESSVNKNGPCIISKGKPSTTITKEKKIRTLRKNSFHPLAKESREKARARARERTLTKIRMLDKSRLCIEATNHDLNQLGSWSTFETGEESGTQSHNMNPNSFEVLVQEVEEPNCREPEINQGTKQDIAGDSLMITGNWSPSTIIFNYQHNNGISQEHQSTDFQFYGKPWEAYNSRNLL